MMDKKITIIGGGGHVGLPLGVLLANRGYSVTAFDSNVETVEKINLGVTPFQEKDMEGLLSEGLHKRTFVSSYDPNSISTADVVIVVIGTPIDEHLNPDPNEVPEAIEKLKQYFKRNQLILMRSTVFPGVTQKVEKKFISLHDSIEVVFCPERLAEGKAIEELQSLPQLIGSRNDKSFERAKKIFDRLGVNSVKVTPEEAELAKLFTNVWRYIKFAAANQFYMIAKTANLDFYKIRDALVLDYPRANDLPRPGFAAGPCLFKDTMALVAFSQDTFHLGNASVSANEGLPGFIVEQISRKFDLTEMTIGILGMAFKADVDDIRSSLSFKLRKILSFKCKQVLMTDPHVSDSRNLPLDEVLSRSDFLIIATPHKMYSNLEIAKPFFDVWNIVKESKSKLE